MVGPCNHAQHHQLAIFTVPLEQSYLVIDMELWQASESVAV